MLCLIPLDWLGRVALLIRSRGATGMAIMAPEYPQPHAVSILRYCLYSMLGGAGASFFVESPLFNSLHPGATRKRHCAMLQPVPH